MAAIWQFFCAVLSSSHQKKKNGAKIRGHDSKRGACPSEPFTRRLFEKGALAAHTARVFGASLGAGAGVKVLAPPTGKNGARRAKGGF